MRKRITIWSKHCVSCLWNEQWMAISNYTQREGIDLKVKRTAYRPDWHWRATRLFGSEDYDVFVVYKNKVEDFMKFADKCKNKLVKAGKQKGTRDDMHSLRRTEGDDREASAADETLETQDKTEG